MKKISFVILALVLVLGTMGFGYSMWFQTININGTVNTGHVTLSVDTPTAEWDYKDLDASTVGDALISMVYGHQLVDANGQPVFDGAGNPVQDLSQAPMWQNNSDWMNAADSLLIGWAAINHIDNTTAGGPTITATWHNLFPVPGASFGDPNTTWETWICDFNVNNTGSIPIKLHIGTPVPNGWPGLNIEVGWWTQGGAVWGIDSLEGHQVEPGQSVHVQIGIQVLQSAAQSFDGSFTLTIQGVQWNEYGEPIPGAAGG